MRNLKKMSDDMKGTSFDSYSYVVDRTRSRMIDFTQGVKEPLPFSDFLSRSWSNHYYPPPTKPGFTLLEYDKFDLHGKPVAVITKPWDKSKM